MRRRSGDSTWDLTAACLSLQFKLAIVTNCPLVTVNTEMEVDASGTVRKSQWLLHRRVVQFQSNRVAHASLLVSDDERSEFVD